MSIRLIKDVDGNSTGVFISMEDWARLVEKHEGLKDLVPAEAVAAARKRAITQALHENEDAMFKYFD